jgi:hypothetical protein
MISVIICSVNPIQLQEVSQNISETIGLPYELISIDNRNGKRGICSIYNEAAFSAKFNLLCFVHEDVKFHTQNWGNVIKEIFTDLEIRLIGVSGSVYKSAKPGSWVSCDKKYYRVNTLQHQQNSDNVEQVSLNPYQVKLSEVAVIDGVFMVTTKNIWNQCRFDEESLNGFHGYDLDFSLQLGMLGKVMVTHEIFLEHFSSGNFNSAWLKDTETLHEKWKQTLPRFKSIVGKEDPFSDYLTISDFLIHILKQTGRRLDVFKIYCKIVLFHYSYNKFRFTKSVFAYIFFNKFHNCQN